jgi:2'-5' RNA ligase superfamily
VTVLYPFVDPAAIDAVLEGELRALFSSTPAFSFRLAEARRFPEGLLYLAPEPDRAFRELTNVVWHRFPGHPPYGGAFDDVIPHLTVLDCQPPGSCDDTALDQAERELGPRLPIRASAREVWLMTGDERWQLRRAFALGPGG